MLIISLIILLVMTLLGVSAMTGSDLQERMVGNQKRMIQASMAAESWGLSWRCSGCGTHPESLGDAKAWQAGDEALPSRPSSSPNFGNAVFWIESIRFEGDTAVIVSRGGVLVVDRIISQSAVSVTLKSEDYGDDLHPVAALPASDETRTGVGAHGNSMLGVQIGVTGANGTDAKNIVTDDMNRHNQDVFTDGINDSGQLVIVDKLPPEKPMKQSACLEAIKHVRNVTRSNCSVSGSSIRQRVLRRPAP